MKKASLAESLERRWVRLYTASWPADKKSDRREEVESELYERRQDLDWKNRTVMLELARLVLGMPADALCAIEGMMLRRSRVWGVITLGLSLMLVSSFLTTWLLLREGSSNLGQLPAFPVIYTSNDDIIRQNPDGSRTILTAGAALNGAPAPSPDGTKIAFISSRDSGGYGGLTTEIYVMDVDGSNISRLTFNPTWDGGPAWSPDGTKIAFVRMADSSVGSPDIYTMNSADGSDVTRLTNSLGGATKPDWSPDGSMLVFIQPGAGLFTMKPDGTQPTRLTTNPDDDFPTWSPDGTKIAFVRAGELYVMNTDGSGIALVKAGLHSSRPAWSPDGAWLLFSGVCSASYGDSYWGIDICAIGVDGNGMPRKIIQGSEFGLEMNDSPNWSSPN